MRRLPVDPLAPDPAVLQPAVALVAAGFVIAYPTDTLYGLAADPFNAEAVARVYEIKVRPGDRAMPLIAADVAQVEAAFGALPPAAHLLAARFWPGPLTLVIPVQVHGDGVRVQVGTDASPSGGILPPPTVPVRDPRPQIRTVAVRVPAHAVARALAAQCGRPIVATSANISGAPPTADPDEVARALEGRIPLLVDAGQAPGGPPSTIVDVSGASPRLLRAGAIAWDLVQACL